MPQGRDDSEASRRAARLAALERALNDPVRFRKSLRRSAIQLAAGTSSARLICWTTVALGTKDAARLSIVGAATDPGIGYVVVGVFAAMFVGTVFEAVGPSIRELGTRWMVGLFALTLTDVVGAFSVLYLEVQRDVPHSFSQSMSGLDAVYLVVTTFTTVGSGSLYPTGELARGLVVLQAVVGLVVITGGVGILLQRLLDRK